MPKCFADLADLRNSQHHPHHESRWGDLMRSERFTWTVRQAFDKALFSGTKLGVHPKQAKRRLPDLVDFFGQ